LRRDGLGRRGFLRIDTVHQGDWNGVKGVYHINAVDAVTQWQVVDCVGRINEQHILPVLEAILHQFPFRIWGFHSDNGSEYVNYEVAKLLKTLLIEFTKSRANRTQDNALVEGKNGAIIRKHMPSRLNHCWSTGGPWATDTLPPSTPRPCRSFTRRN
jgi:transposase InsO family protein